MTENLGDFEGKPIRKTGIEIRNTGHGLSTALKIDPVVVHSGEKAYVVLEIVGEKHRFDPMDDGDAWERVNLTKAEVATVVDKELVMELIEAQRAKNLAAAEEAKGIQQIDADGTAGTLNVLTPERLREQHELGDHKRARKDCELCTKASEARKAAKADKATKNRGGAK